MHLCRLDKNPQFRQQNEWSTLCMCHLFLKFSFNPSTAISIISSNSAQHATAGASPRQFVLWAAQVPIAVRGDIFKTNL